MPSADVAVIGAGLAGMLTAVRLAEDGARVVVLTEGNGALHWAGGPIDVGFVPGKPTAAAAIDRLGRRASHPYAVLWEDVAPAVDWFVQLTSDLGLPHAGSLADEFGALPTGIG